MWTDAERLLLGLDTVDLSAYSTTTATNSAITTALADYSTTTATNSALTTALADYSTTTATNTAITTALSDYSTTTATNTALTTALADYSTTSAMDSAIAAATPTYSPPTGAEIPDKYLGNFSNRKIGNFDVGLSASTLDGLTFSEMFNKMIFPETFASVTAPFASLSWGEDSFIVIGTSISTTLSCSCNDGQIRNADNSVQSNFATGNLSGASLSGFTGNQTLTVSGRESISNFTVTHTALIGSQTATLTVSWEDGPMPTSSIGSNQTSDQFLASSKTADVTYTGVYPIYLGDSSFVCNTQHTLVAHNQNNIEIQQDYDEGGSVDVDGDGVNETVHHQIAIPNVMVGSRSIAAGTLAIQAKDLTGAFVTPPSSPWVTSSITKSINSSSVPYTLLIKSGSQGGAQPYKIVFS